MNRYFYLLVSASMFSSANIFAASQFSKVIVFGDSTVDAGYLKGWFALGNTAGCPNFDNYIPDAIAHGANTAPVGAGNMNYTQILAEMFGLTANPVNQAGGTNYAISGAMAAAVSANGNAGTLCNSTVIGNTNTGLPSTSQQISNYLASNSGLADTHALYIIQSGGNDIKFAEEPAVGYNASAQQNYVSSQAALLAGAVQTLAAAGALHIVVSPSGSGDSLATYYNQALYAASTTTGVNFTWFDQTVVGKALKANPTAFGFGAAFISSGTVGAGTDSACVSPVDAPSTIFDWGLFCVNSTVPSATHAYLRAANSEQTSLFSDNEHKSASGQRGIADFLYTLVVPPSGTALGISSISWTWATNSVSTNVYTSFNIYSASATDSLLGTVSAPPFLQVGLDTNTAGGIVVAGVSTSGQGPLTPSATAYTSAAPPNNFVLTQVSSSAINASWETNTNPGQTSYQLQYWMVHGSTFSRTITGTEISVSDLSPATTYYLIVDALNGNNVPTFASVALATVTVAAVPGTAAFSKVAATSLQANWTGGGNPARTLYELQWSTTSDFSGVVLASNTYNAFVSTGDLSPDTTYYFHVQALGAGQPSGFVRLGGISTLAFAPKAVAATFTGSSADTLSVAWQANGNLLNVTTYTVVLTTASSYPNADAGDIVSSATPIGPPAAILAGYEPSTLYNLFVAAVNWNGVASAYVRLGSTLTYAAAPSLGFFSNVTPSSLKIQWSTDGNPPKTSYQVRVSTVADDFSVKAKAISVTTTSALATGLAGNTTFYFEAAALNKNKAISNFVSLGSTSTLAAEPKPGSFVKTSSTAIEVSWSNNGNRKGTLYSLEASTAANFTGVVTTSDTYNTSASTAGLSSDTLYYFEVAALGNNGNWTAFVPIGSKKTLISTGVRFLESGKAANLEFAGPTGPITIYFPAMELPAPTPVELREVSDTLRTLALEAHGNRAHGASFEVVIGDGLPLPPNTNMVISMSYKPSDAGDPKRLFLARYDPEQGWVALRSSLNKKQKRIIATTDRLQAFQLTETPPHLSKPNSVSPFSK